MFGIGQFAQFAKVSVRTLRHYDQLGLLRPAAVDPHTGYRFYRPAQLSELNRIVALKDLGFSLSEIGEFLSAGVSNEQLLGMLRLRQADAERAIDEERRRLSRVAARIALLTGEPHVPDSDTAIVIKSLDPLHLVTASEPVDGFDADFGPVFGRLFGRLMDATVPVGIAPTGPSVCLYTEMADGRVLVTAALPIAPDATVEAPDLEMRDLPAVERAATFIHHGDMAGCSTSYARLQHWMDATGEQPVGFSREINLDCMGDRDSWVTELQFVLDDR